MSSRTRRNPSPLPLSPMKATFTFGSVGIGPNAPCACPCAGTRARARRVARILPTTNRWLLITERLDRVEAGRLPRRIEPEEDADGGREAEGQHDRIRRDQRPPLGEVADRTRAGETGRDTDQAADHRERDGLDEELHEDVSALGPTAIRNPILPRPSVTRPGKVFIVPMAPHKG